MKYLIALATIILVGGFLDGNYAGDEFRHFNDWSKSEKLAFTSFTALQAIDVKQTAWGLKQRDETGAWKYKEANPLYGNRPSTGKLLAIQSLTVLSLYFLVGETPPDSKFRRRLYMALIPIKIAVVTRNNHYGLTFSKVM